MAPRRRNTIDNEELIRLVRDRPYIWDSRIEEYKNHARKSRGWVEICQSLYADWDDFTPHVRKIKQGLIRTRWRSLKDTLQRHQRLEREARSGSGAPPKRPYAFARYMDFLRPVLELRNTEASWEEEEEEKEEGEEHAATVDVDEGVSFASSNHEDLAMELQGEVIEVNESSSHELDNEDTDVSTPSSRRQRQASTSRRKQSCRAAEQVEDQDQTKKLLHIVSGITEQIDAQRCPHTMFAISLVPLLKEVLPDYYFNMRIAVEHCIHSFTVPRHVSVPTHQSLSTQIFSPISTASNTAPNPYPSSFAEPTSIYETPRSRIPYPIPSPVASVISPPNTTADISRPMDMRPLESTSYHVPSQNRPQQLYEQIPSVAKQFPPVARPMEQHKPLIQNPYLYHNQSIEVASNMHMPYRQYGPPSVPPDTEISPPVPLRKYPSTQDEALLTPPSSSTLQRHDFNKPGEHSSPSFLNL